MNDAGWRVAFPPIFRSEAQFRLLGELFGVPGAELAISELADRVGSSHPTVSREVTRLADAGLVRIRSQGRRTLVSAATDSPLFGDLRALLTKTYGPFSVLRDEFSGLASRLVVFGSFAARWEGEPGPVANDIDVLVITDAPAGEIWAAAARASQRVGLEVTPVIRTAAEWDSEDSGFARSVGAGPMIELDLPAASEEHTTAGESPPNADRWG